MGNVDSSQQQLLWSTTDGAGLSMLRSRIRPDTSSSSDEIFAMQKAQAMGVTIWSTPWSPPAAWKSNNNVATIVNGVDTMGYLLASHYQDYANWLKQYVINMANNGITIYAVSMQNEPNWSADYESARWSASQFHDALSILHDTLAADSRTANVKIILPEEIHWNNLDLVSQVMSDPVESNYTNVIYADHTYGINTIAGGKDGFAPISGLNGHQIWETEHTGDDPGLGITAGLNEAQSIYDIVYVAQASAYHHWWTNATGGAGLLNGKWQTTKLYSAMDSILQVHSPGLGGALARHDVTQVGLSVLAVVHLVERLAVPRAAAVVDVVYDVPVVRQESARARGIPPLPDRRGRRAPSPLPAPYWCSTPGAACTAIRAPRGCRRI